MKEEIYEFRPTKSPLAELIKTGKKHILDGSIFNMFDRRGNIEKWIFNSSMGGWNKIKLLKDFLVD